MIFHEIEKSELRSRPVKEAAVIQKLEQLFNFNEVLDLMYESNKEKLLEVNKNSPQFCVDIIGAIFKPLYQKDIKISSRIYNALIFYFLFLTAQIKANESSDKSKKRIDEINNRLVYEFLGLILRDEEYLLRANDENEYYKNICIEDTLLDVIQTKGNVYSNGVKRQGKELVKIKRDATTKPDGSISETGKAYKHPIEHIFNNSEPASEKPYTIFIVLGSQTMEMLYSRIRKSAILISDLIIAGKIDFKRCLIILSGRNNAKSEEMKVNYPNEAYFMKNKLIYRLRKYLNKEEFKEAFEFITSDKCLRLEYNSTKTSENIDEVLKILPKNINAYNIFIISNTFHLPQVSNELRAMKESEGNRFLPQNLYLVGSENPNDLFRVNDAEYIKFLFKDAIRLCSNKF